MFKTTILTALLLVVSPFAWADTDIEQQGQKFSESDITVKAGDTVHFLNHDDVNHNITVMDANGDPEDQGLQKPGETITKKFDKPGDYHVRCLIHPRMKMSITVQ